jgi:hypothetical protein
MHFGNSVCSLCGVHKTKVRGFKIPLSSLASEIKLNKFKFPVTRNETILIQLLRRFEALFGYYRRILSCHIHLNCTDIKIWQNFQEGIPFLLEAAAQFSDFWHIINKIKEKNELKLALTNPPVVIDRMDDCLAMYHKLFDAQRISFVSAQCLGRGQL